MNNDQIKQWEKEFDEAFCYRSSDGTMKLHAMNHYAENFKGFISNLLSSFLKDIVPDEIMLDSVSNDVRWVGTGHNSCRSQILERARERYNIEIK